MKKVITGVIVVAALVAAGFWYAQRGGDGEANIYRFVAIQSGDLESMVTSTGNLGAVTTVQVGTQVSGIVNQIYVDFNDRVRKGQIIAKIDTTLLASAIRDARANLDRSMAQLKQAEREKDRITDLFEKQFVAETEYNVAVFNYDVAASQVSSSEITLERARQNLSYATIYSPIDGIVIERNVDVGQTVAASLSAPQLFLIANDLSQMQILASVDESDIGRIKEEMTARFTVQAYPDEAFFGTVRQVRMQSTTQENVVNYTVVVDVANPDGQLLPGMTAVVDFLIDKAEDVLMVPNAALRFRPTAAMMETIRARSEQSRTSVSDSSEGATAGGTTRVSSQSPGGFAMGAGAPGRGVLGSGDSVMIWYLDDAGRLQMTRARVGITDGSTTEISGEGIEAGLQVIAGVTEVADEGTASPFQTTESSDGRRRFGAF
jgi:HlyD family secretion protein